MILWNERLRTQNTSPDKIMTKRQIKRKQIQGFRMTKKEIWWQGTIETKMRYGKWTEYENYKTKACKNKIEKTIWRRRWGKEEIPLTNGPRNKTSARNFRDIQTRENIEMRETICYFAIHISYLVMEGSNKTKYLNFLIASILFFFALFRMT